MIQKPTAPLSELPVYTLRELSEKVRILRKELQDLKEHDLWNLERKLSSMIDNINRRIDGLEKK